MKFIQTLAITLITLGSISAAAWADSVVSVTLIDKVGNSTTEVPDMGMGTGGDLSKAKMGMNVSPKSVRPGVITFKVTNLASTMIHEVIVAGLPDGFEKLPYDETSQQVKEDSLQKFGSINQIEPNGLASISLKLNRGRYLLYCNLPGHYMAGMWAIIDVSP